MIVLSFRSKGVQDVKKFTNRGKMSSLILFLNTYYFCSFFRVNMFNIVKMNLSIRKRKS